MIEYVTKRDGSKEKFDPNKLSKWAEWASVVGVDWFSIVGEAYKKCSDGVPTEELHKALISSCIDQETSHALLMAGRLMVGELYKNVFGGVEHIPSLNAFYDKMVKDGYWEDMGYDEFELGELDTALDHKNDFNLSSTQVLQDIQKYLITDLTTKSVKETPQFGLMRQAMGAHKNQPKDRRISDVIGMYKDLQGILNTPTPNKTNLGTTKTSYASCCKSMATDELNSIEAQNHINWTMTAASAGQGNYLQTRSAGDGIRGGTIKHGGKLPYFRLQEDECKANKQGGRGGAITTYLNALDPEIFTLLSLRNPTSVDDKRIDGMDYAFQFNNSFKERAKTNKDWLLVSYKDAPKLWELFFGTNMDVFDIEMDRLIAEGTFGKVIKTRNLLKKFLEENEVTGRLYEFNATNVNLHTSFQETIFSSNLCLEYLAPTKPYKHVTELYAVEKEVENTSGETAICNLAAIAVGKFPMKKYDEIAYRTLLMVDNVIEVGTFPLPQVSYTAKSRRTAGIGITNLAYAMADAGYTYDSQAGKDFMHRLAEQHIFSLLKASVQLAKEKGKCKWFHKTRYAQGWLPIDTYNKNVDNITKQPLLCDWEWLRKEIATHGLRNSALVNHMPVESSSVRGGDTNSLYPIRDGVVIKTSGNTKIVFIAPEWERLQGFYQFAWDISAKDITDMYAIFTKFADQGISADYYRWYNEVEKKVSLKKLMEDFFYRADTGVKTRYYTNFKVGVSEVQQADSCAGGACKL